VSVTVNVSPRQILQSDFGDTVLEALEESGAPPDALTLEITEGALARDVDTVWAALRQLKAAGVHVTLDDFGTGQTSLGHLRRYQLDDLKIDRMFVKDMVTSREDAAIVEQLIGLAHALGMRAIAEGVETLDQVDALKAFGADGAQGFYFSTPQPADVIDRFLAKGRIDRSDRPLALEEVRRATVVRPDLP
jgi:EAL domain-containing protein (putative c-di-GMP-specific phosphodiesterase class I)